MPQNDQRMPDFGQYLPVITFWATAFLLGLGVFLESGRIGLSIIAFAFVSWLGLFLGWLKSVLALKYGRPA